MRELILLGDEASKACRRPRAGAGGPGGEGPVRPRPELRVVPRPAAGDGAAGACRADDGAACDIRRAAHPAGAPPGATWRGAGRLVLLHGKKTIVVW
ncbi:MAG TPA: hypothetical protein VFS43_07145 [Polyangiaceae bacterium]|nr:hypothetical protein [Polyangiaceae bacterium]